MKRTLIIMLTSFCFVSFAQADSETTATSAKATSPGWFHVGPQATTVFPTFLGGGAQFLLWRHLELGAQYGLTPSAYYHEISNIASHFAGNDDYKNIINAAFQDNHIVRAVAQYDFSGATGWRIGLAGNWLHSSGDASVDDVLKAANGSSDYTALKAALAAQGKSSVNMKTDLMMGEVYAGYAWQILHHLCLSFDLGVLKVFDADVKLNGGTNYEQTNAGKTLVNSTQSDIESIVKKYGISPTAQLSLAYWF